MQQLEPDPASALDDTLPARPKAARVSVGWAHAGRLFVHFLRRDLRERFIGSFSGGLWALIQPLIQLAIYSFVFVHIFKARGPGNVEYVPFLALALWPWVAFSEAVMRATTAIIENSSLIGKVAMPRSVPVLATVAASFLLHSAGYVAILLVLPLFGYPIHFAWIPLALLVQALLMLLATGFGLMFSALQVFVRDLAQVVTQLLSLLIFVAPIFYARSMIPQRFQVFIDAHPYTWYAVSFRDMLLHGHAPALVPSLIAVAVALVVLVLGAWVFHRLDRHFEDFL